MVNAMEHRLTLWRFSQPISMPPLKCSMTLLQENDAYGKHETGNHCPPASPM